MPVDDLNPRRWPTGPLASLLGSADPSLDPTNLLCLLDPGKVTHEAGNHLRDCLIVHIVVDIKLEADFGVPDARLVLKSTLGGPDVRCKRNYVIWKGATPPTWAEVNLFGEYQPKIEHAPDGAQSSLSDFFDPEGE